MRLAKLPIINKPWRDGWIDASGEKELRRLTTTNAHTCTRNEAKCCAHSHLSISNAFITDNTYLSARFIACNDLIFSQVVIIANSDTTIFLGYFRCIETLCEPMNVRGKRANAANECLFSIRLGDYAIKMHRNDY